MYFYFGAINFSGKQEYLAARWTIDGIGWQSGGKKEGYVKGKVCILSLPRPSGHLITRMLSNGARSNAASTDLLLFYPRWSSMGTPWLVVEVGGWFPLGSKCISLENQRWREEKPAFRKAAPTFLPSFLQGSPLPHAHFLNLSAYARMI